MEEKPLDKKTTEAPKSEKPITPAASPSQKPSAQAQVGSGTVKPSAPKPTAPKPTKPKPIAAKADAKSKSRVTPEEANRLRVALLLKLSKAPDGMRSADLANSLGISSSRLTYVIDKLIKSNQVKKTEKNERVVYMIDKAKPAAPVDQTKVLWEKLLDVLKAAPKGLKLTDLADKTKIKMVDIDGLLKDHIKSGEVKKEGLLYLLTGKSPVQKPAAPKPELKKAPEKKIPHTTPRPTVKPAYRPPQKVKTGKGVAWLSLLPHSFSV